MNYEPDWTNSRTQKRLLQRLASVLCWSRLFLDNRSFTEIHSSNITDVFGSHSNDFTSWLTSKLLYKNSSYLRGKVSMGYKLNIGGYKELSAFIHESSHNRAVLQGFEANPVVRKYKDQLDTLEFKYKDSSNRLWHPLQNIKRDMKQEFWAPYLPYDYDVEACAPTIILQLARKAGMSHQVTPGIVEYLENKDRFRNQIMELAGLSYSDSKRLINSLFNGVKLIPHFECAAFDLVGRNSDTLKLIRDNRDIIRLQGAIKRCWDHIEIGHKLKLSSGSSKWAIYFKAEREILNVVMDELTKRQIKFFTEHDGFRTNVPINKEELICAIKQRSGFELKLSGMEAEIVNPAHQTS